MINIKIQYFKLETVLFDLIFVVLPEVGASYYGRYTFFTCTATEGTILRAKITVTDVTKSSNWSFLRFVFKYFLLSNFEFREAEK